MRGEQIYTHCLAGHALAYGRERPRHSGLFGRRTGSVPQFSYSPAMKKSGMVWNNKTPHLFLMQPLKVVPGAAMTYDGVANPKERADLIAYLKHVHYTTECAKQAPLHPR